MRAPPAPMKIHHRFPLSAALLAGCLASSLAGCGSSDVNQPSPPPVDPRIYQQAALRAAVPQRSAFETERESIEAFGRALTSGETKAIAPLVDPDGDFSFPGMQEVSDRDGMVKALDDLFGAFSGRKYAASRVFQVGETAIVEWAMLAVHSGDWMGVKATQKSVGIKGITLYTFNLNGLINDVHVYFDVGAVLAQLGAGPKGVEVPAPPTLAATPMVVVAGGTPEEKSHVITVNASWDALESKNEAGYLAPMADTIEVLRLDKTAPQIGKEGRKRFFQRITHGLSSLTQTPLNAWGIGPYVVEEYSITGVHSGKLTEGPPSGHAVRLHAVDVSEIADTGAGLGDGGAAGAPSSAKIVRTWTYSNSLELLAETGEAEHASPGTSAAFVH
jgi:hypothetical protein